MLSCWADMQNVQITALPAEAAPVEQICSYPSLLNCHASAPSVRADLAYTCILHTVYPKIAITHRRLGVVYFQPNPSSEINEILELRLSLRKVFGGWHLHLGFMYSTFSFE